MRQRITMALVLLAAAGGSTLWCNTTGRPTSAVVTGLAPEDAAAIVQRLKETGGGLPLPEGVYGAGGLSARLAEM